MLARRSITSGCRSLVAGITLVLLQAIAVHAQTPTPAPWSGIAADEAKVPGPFYYGANDMSPRSLSADGRFVVFHSNLPNLVPNDTNNWNDVFLRDRVARELTRVSVSTSGVEGNNYSTYPSISADGRHITFYSCASNFDPLDANGVCDFFVRDRELGTTVRVSIGPNGEDSTSLGASYQARLSGDGRYAVFAAAFGSAMQVWLRDRDTDENGVFDEPGMASTTQISTDFVEGLRVESGGDLAISNDGRYIAFVAQACADPCSNFLGYRMYVHDRVTAQTYRIDRPSAGYFDETAYSSGPDFSDNGLLAYTSTQPNLVEGHFNPNGDIYVFNLITGGNALVQIGQPGAPVIEYVWTPAISADGRYVAFTGMVWNFGNPAYNVYAFDRQTLTTTLVSVHAYYGNADDHASAPSMTADGSGIAFAAEPGVILDGWGSRGVFVAGSIALTPADTDVPETGGSYTLELTAPATTGWELQHGPNTSVHPSSGTGSATIEVTIAPNTTPDDMTSSVILGSEQAAFHQTAPPQIHYTMPYYGPTSGGTDVDIWGVGFAEGMSVEFGGASATSVTFINSAHIVATTPAHYGGWVTIKVTKAGGASAELFDMFYFDDETAPIVTSQVTGTLGANGWYISDVNVTWTVGEDESAIGTEPCLPFSQTTDVDWMFATCYAESAGGGTFAEVQIRRDTQAPTIALAPAYPETYAQGEQVPIALACSDETSGVNPVNCTTNQAGPYLDTSTAGTFVLSATAVDMAGHTAATSTSYTVKMWTGLTVPVASAVYGSETAALRATLIGPASPLAGKTITFFVDNVAVGTAVTAANGEAILSVPLNGRNAGSYEMHAEFAGDDIAFASMLSSALTVNKATPVVTWANPSPIVTTTPLGSTQLNATASVPGSFLYQPGFWTTLPAGTHTLSVQFAPQDAANYEVVTKTVTVKVKAIPVITWPAPAAITYPAFLGAAQLNATADTAGSFVYNWPAGTLLDAGTHTLYVTFTPSNTADYVSASTTTTIEVVKGTVTINWPPYINPFFYGQQLTGLQLNAEASAPGSLTYSPPYGTILDAGTQTLTVTYTSNSPANYHPATATQQLLVRKAYPVVYWQGDLAPIVYGTPLGPAQLYATSPNAGTITYDPPAGTVLDAAPTPRTISMTFTPDDTANYNTVTYQKQIAVDKQTTTVTWNNPAPIVYGTALSAAQLTATASQPGTFSYNPPAGTVLNAGTHTLSVYFTPTSANYYGGNWTVTLVVTKRTPAITWSNPAPIVYGTALSNTQLNASANTAGTFTYTPAAGTVLGAGTRTLSATFEPSDPANNNAASASTTIVVNSATPVITWPDQGHITYGTALSASQLNATANVPGTFAYSPDFGAVLPAGNYTLSVTFTPADAANYAPVSDTALLAVFKQTAQVTWPAPPAITYGTPLSATELNATANVPGTFVYIPAAGTVLGAGTPTLYVNFTPDDTANYLAPGSVGVTLQVNQATPVISWATPSSITWGTALSAAQLNATANVPGTLAYNPGTGVVLGAGSHTLGVTFTPSDTTDYATAVANVIIEVNRAAPVITWSAPAAITYGTALTGTQLNASANVPGTFAYSPAAGAVLNAGTQPLSVVFTPTDSANYIAATAGVSIVVGKAAPVVSWTNPAGITYGTALSSTQLNATADVPGTFTYSPASGTVLGAGIHALAVTFAPADAGNYNAEAAQQSITVAAVPLTVRTADASKVYGQALPAFTASGTGLVNGDTLASLTGTLAYATPATADSAPGTYQVTPSGVSSPNYTITFAAGTLTVAKASTTVALTTTPNPSSNNQTVQLRAVVSAVAPGAGTATGTVEFRDNGVLLGTAQLVNGVATFNKNFKKGTRPLTATYVGNSNFTGSSGGVTHQTN
jgi:hypothetical protein